MIFIAGYGTMPNMKAFEENDSRTGTQVKITIQAASLYFSLPNLKKKIFFGFHEVVTVLLFLGVFRNKP